MKIYIQMKKSLDVFGKAIVMIALCSFVFVGGVQANGDLLDIDLSRDQFISEAIAKHGDSIDVTERASIKAALGKLSAGQLKKASEIQSAEGLMSFLSLQNTSIKLDRSKALGELTRDLVYTPITPCRIVDTRQIGLVTNAVATAYDAVAPSFTSQGGSSSDCGIPGEARALAVSVAVPLANIPGGAGGWVTMWAQGEPIPLAASVVFPATSSTNPQHGSSFVLPICSGASCASGKEFQVAPSHPVYLIIDVNGYFMPPSRTGNGLRVVQTTGIYPNAPITINGSSGNIATAQGAAVISGGYSGANCTNPTTGNADYGCENQATGAFSTVGGGYSNRASGFVTTVVGGQTNSASGSSASVLGGQQNAAIGDNSVIVGGFKNRTTETGIRSIVIGGQSNEARGDSSFAGGTKAIAVHDGAFVWSDFGQSFNFSSSAANEFAARARGGVRFVTAIDLNGNVSAGVGVAAGSGTWTNLSDRSAKSAFSAVKPQDILSKVLALPITTWQYKSQDKSVRHIGPMSQDFRKAFGVGETDKGITTVDADGVALAAIQGLNQKLVNALKTKDIELAKLSAELSHIKKKLGL